MIDPLQLVWFAFIACLVLVLLVLIEIHRINYRRENEDMFGTKAFEDKVAEYAFSDKEKRTLDKIIRYSSFENKDAVLNSAGLFEQAVTNFYDVRDVFQVRDETLAAVERIRNKLDFSATNPLTEVCSTRQFSVGDRIDLFLDDGATFKHSSILRRNEKEWAISYDNNGADANLSPNQQVRVRWTRPDDALYTAKLPIRYIEPGVLILPHSSSLDKRQLRRWVREQVSFPVEALFDDGSSCKGFLLDLSAGGIMVGMPRECYPGQHVRIKFELPSFGEENVDIEILRNLGHRSEKYPDYFCLTASFSGAFGWIQERVLQYLFETGKARKKKIIGIK